MACSLPGYNGREVALEVAYACGDVNPLTLAWAPIGALRTKEFNLTWDTSDASSDDSIGSLRANIATWQTLEVTFDGVCKRQDGTKSNQTRLAKHTISPGPDYSGQPVVWVRMTFPDLTFIFYALSTEMSRSAPFDDIATFNGAFSATESDFGLIVVDTPQPGSTNPTAVTVTPDTLALETGDVANLSATVAPAGAVQGVVWSSSAPLIASVDQSGVVRAQSEGVATITATSTGPGNLTDTCAVTVTDPE